MKESYNKVLTNFPLYSSDVQMPIEQGRMFIETTNKCIYVYEERIDYQRLYYFVPQGEEKEFSEYLENKRRNRLICEILEKENMERQTSVVKVLLTEGFFKYKRYFKWEKDLSSISENDISKNVSVPLSGEVLDEIIEMFDKYTDCVPLRDEWINYCKSREMIISCKEGNLAGRLIFHKQKGFVNLDYIYVIPEYRGEGVSSVLMSEFSNISRNILEVKKVNSWIEENNVYSIGTHMKADYKKTPQNKTVYIR